MSDSVLSGEKLPRTSAKPVSSLGVSLALVVGFWWAATGVTLAMQQSALAGTVSLVVATVMAVVGAVLINASRRNTTVQGARFAFLGSSLVWWWCSTLFYAGIGVRINSNVEVGPRTFELALQAILATLRADLFGVFALVAVAVAVWRSPNRLAFWTLLTFWSTLQTAKLNVFMGVRNSGADWLPEHLSGLSQFFGPAVNSWLLPLTIAGLCACLILVVHRAQIEKRDFARHASAMIALLLALAVVEHVFLGLDMSLPLWEIFKPRVG